MVLAKILLWLDINARVTPACYSGVKMHHKRGRPKNRRSGCLLCKYYKGNGFKGGRVYQTLQEQKARISEKEQRSSICPRWTDSTSRS